jgi:hypothetical protein
MSDPYIWMVFSLQLQRWKQFRTYQNVSRLRRVGYAEFLDECRRDSESNGHRSEWIKSPRYEDVTRSQWENTYGHLKQLDEDDAEAALSRYAEVVTELLMDCGFVQPFQLHQDPKQQDQWTTYVEYLAFEHLWLRRFSGFARRLLREHDARWEGLVKAGLVQPLETNDELTSMEIEVLREQELRRATLAKRSFTAATSTTAMDAAVTNLVEESYTKNDTQFLRSSSYTDDAVRKYVWNRSKHITASAEAHHHRSRVEWVQSEICKIAAQQRVVGDSGIMIGVGSRKRKLISDGEVNEDKRTKEMMVDSPSDNLRTTRSKKRKFATEDGAQGPQLNMEERAAGEIDGLGRRSKKQRKAVHEQLRGDPSSVP